jgi:hypothetical protein
VKGRPVSLSHQDEKGKNREKKRKGEKINEKQAQTNRQ